MPFIIKQDVLEFAPDLSRLRDPMWAVILAFANSLDETGIDPRGGPDSIMLRLARILLAAHYATVSLRAPSGAIGPVTSEAAGQVRTSYGMVALASRDAALGSTIWGQQYLGLLAMSDAHGPVLL